jgi:hypothetical protein
VDQEWDEQSRQRGRRGRLARARARRAVSGYAQLHAIGRAGRRRLRVQGAWEVALVGRNLTDENVVGYSVDVPLAGAVFLAPGVSGYTRPPRTVAVQAALRF